MAHILRLKAKATGEENLLLFYHIPSEDLPLEEKEIVLITKKSDSDRCYDRWN
jgi:hypothetical protein